MNPNWSTLVVNVRSFRKVYIYLPFMRTFHFGLLNGRPGIGFCRRHV